MLNLDDLEYEEITLKGKVYKFKIPAVDELQGIMQIEEKTNGIEDPKEVMRITAEEIVKAVPELPLEDLKTLNGKQLKNLVVYIIGSDMDSINAVLLKKKS